MATPFAAFLFVQPVLKWLHHLLAKYVMDTHVVVSSQDFLHAASLATKPDEAATYFSPPA